MKRTTPIVPLILTAALMSNLKFSFNGEFSGRNLPSDNGDYPKSSVKR